MTLETLVAKHLHRGPVRRLVYRLVPIGARRWLRVRISRAGRLADLYMFLNPQLRGRRVSRHTDLVIDGGARSANTYAFFVLIHTHGETLSIAHHLHTPRVIERGVQLGKPTIVLIREPRAVLASLLQYDPGPASLFLNFYLGYYERVEPLLDHVVLADFTEVIGDFGAVMERCNERFGTKFVRYERTVEDEAAVVGLIDKWAGRVITPEQYEMRVGRPSVKRRSPEEMLANLAPRDQQALAKAELLYARCRALA